MINGPAISRQVSLPVSLPKTELPNPQVPAWQQFAGLTLRSVFILALAVLTVRVALPQNETIGTAYDTPSDLVRLLLGLGVCVWLVIQLFRIPHDRTGYRTWFYLRSGRGVGFTPGICLAYIW